MAVFEVNFDSLVGQTHNYAGLSYGNLASLQNAQTESNPKAAALQGLEKMHLLMQMGIKQAVLPPHQRPNIPFLKSLGFEGSPEKIIQSAWDRHPEALIASGSAAPMWAANAAVAVPSSDTQDGKLHVTPANLSSKFHRAHEVPMTTYILKRIFRNETLFTVHPPLPSRESFSDEGAANYTRLCHDYSQPGTHLFVFGRYATQVNLHAPKIFPARQTFEASQAVATQNLLDPSKIVFAQQHPDAIDAGAFHNDVVSVGNERVFFYHEKAFLNTEKVIGDIQKRNHELILIPVSENQLTLAEAIGSYLFNSQIVSIQNGSMVLICPIECQEMDATRAIVDHIVQDRSNPIDQVIYVNLKQSMNNGGGPACLRLRIVMTEEEIKEAHQGIFLNEELYKKLKLWIEKYYRDRLKPSDLIDPLLLKETTQALDELTKILKLDNLYPFQKTHG